MDIEKLTVVQLKQILRSKNLPTSGNKPVLLQRVRELTSEMAPMEVQVQKQSKWVSTGDRDYANFVNKTFKEHELPSFDISIDPCKKTQGIQRKLFDHQRFLKQYFGKLTSAKNPGSRGVFLYHTVGSGKTITALSMAEQARGYTENGITRVRKVVGLIPASLRNSPWINEIGRIHSDHSTETMMARIGYFLYHYNNTTSLLAQLKQLAKSNNNSNPFDNSIVIIDEVHNILNTLPNAKPQSVRIQLYNWMMKAKNAFFIMLSGTPISNTPFELAYAINILRGSPVINVSNADSQDRFINKFYQNDKIVNAGLFKRNIQGLFSYFIGADPRAFGKKQIHNEFIPMSDYQWKVQSQLFRQEEDLSKGIDRSQTGVSRTDTESQIKTIKRARALKARGVLKDALAIRSGQDADDDESLFHVFTRSNSNFVYPKSVLEKYARSTFNGILNPKNFSQAIKEVDFNQLPELSPKLYKMMKNVSKSNGPLIIYSSFEGAYGISLIEHILQFHGYSKLHNTATTKAPRYAVWSGNTSSDTRQHILKTINNKNNTTGEYLKIICITSAGKEGISLTGIRQIHLVEPWWNMNRPLQVIGRGVRICSHSHLPAQDRVIDIYNYLSFPPKGVPKTQSSPAVDITIMKSAQNKQKRDAGFLQVLRESALDCELNKKQTKVEHCTNYANYPTKSVYSSKFDNANSDAQYAVYEDRSGKYLLKGGVVFKYLTSTQIESGIVPQSIGNVVLNSSGEITGVKLHSGGYQTTMVQGQRFLTRDGKLYHYISQQDLMNGLLPRPV
jgi:SNF2 family DNA or RNA helicase